MHVICKCTPYIYERSKLFWSTLIPYDTNSYFTFIHELSTLTQLRNLYEYIEKCIAISNEWYILYESNQGENHTIDLIN